MPTITSFKLGPRKIKQMPCKFCGRPIAPCGMPAHIHFKHLEEYMGQVGPILQIYLAVMPDPIKQLPEHCQA